MELLHTASLVHDDVVDESGMRRGQSSINALLDNKAAVLVGDYLLSTSLKCAARTGDLRVVYLISHLGQALSDGELQQLANISSAEISEKQYFHVIKQKTASLFAICAEIGAMLSGASADEIAKMRDFGMTLGVCFQIRDDVFDYYNEQVGKPTGNDMKEGKLTLPVIHAVIQSGSEDWRALAMKVRTGEATDAEIAQLVEFTKSTGGIDYAHTKMNEMREYANSLLRDSKQIDIVDSLSLYLDFVLKRRS